MLCLQSVQSGLVVGSMCVGPMRLETALSLIHSVAPFLSTAQVWIWQLDFWYTFNSIFKSGFTFHYFLSFIILHRRRLFHVFQATQLASACRFEPCRIRTALMYATLKRMVLYFEEGGMVLWRGWYGTLKRVVWYFEWGCTVLWRVLCICFKTFGSALLSVK